MLLCDIDPVECVYYVGQTEQMTEMMLTCSKKRGVPLSSMRPGSKSILSELAVMFYVAVCVFFFPSDLIKTISKKQFYLASAFGGK